MNSRLLIIAEKMANDLREYAQAARDAGAPIEKTEEIIEEFDRVLEVEHSFGVLELD